MRAAQIFLSHETWSGACLLLNLCCYDNKQHPPSASTKQLPVGKQWVNESSNPQCLNKDWPIRTHHCFYINNTVPVTRPTNHSVEISTVVFCCTAGFWHPFSVSIPLCPQLPILVQQSHRHLPNRVAFEFFSLFLVYLSFCLQLFHAKVGHVSKHGQSIDVSFAKHSSVFTCLHLLSWELPH